MDEIHSILDWLKEKLPMVQYGEIIIRFFVHQGRIVKSEKTITEKEKTK